MRHFLVAAYLAAAVAVPVLAQSGLPLDRRVEKLEKELRAVQRKVFPSGAGITVEPEIGPQTNAQPIGVPASTALSDINARVDSLESQLRSLTSQVEEANHRLRLADQALANFRTATESRLATLEQAGAAPASATSSSGASSSETATTSTGDPGEEAYLEGFRLWNGGKFTEAQRVLEAMVKKYPKHPRASFAQNLLGRAYLDGGKPATAAKVLLANYEGNRNGERAQDSLFYLGLALTQLNRPADACKAFDELEDVFKGKIRGAIRQDLPKARTAAKCR